MLRDDINQTEIKYNLASNPKQILQEMGRRNQIWENKYPSLIKAYEDAINAKYEKLLYDRHT